MGQDEGQDDHGDGDEHDGGSRQVHGLTGLLAVHETRLEVPSEDADDVPERVDQHQGSPEAREHDADVQLRHRCIDEHVGRLVQAVRRADHGSHRS